MFGKRFKNKKFSTEIEEEYEDHHEEVNLGFISNEGISVNDLDNFKIKPKKRNTANQS